ncbi:hypothetical protein [Spiroplasma endosymbiont of Panorpa germanica]|uniref:hypothetical protein n=1 Tax=Spiroplasma endosymbiont of Panorpa germanica TaxID=3066314 RepID=UPI0030D0B256
MYLNEINILETSTYIIGTTLLGADDNFYYLLNLKKLGKGEPDYLNYFKSDIFELKNDEQNWYWDKMVSNCLFDLSELEVITIKDETALLDQSWEINTILKLSRKKAQDFKLARYITNYQLSDLLEAVVSRIDKNNDYYPIFKDNSVVLRDLILDN